MLGLLGLGRRAGRVVIGARAVRTAARRGRLAAILVAGDAAENARRRLGSEARAVPCVTYGTRASLGRALGRAEVAVVGVLDRSLARQLVARCEAVGEGP